jgi:hypothetical protein
MKSQALDLTANVARKNYWGIVILIFTIFNTLFAGNAGPLLAFPLSTKDQPDSSLVVSEPLSPSGLEGVYATTLDGLNILFIGNSFTADAPTIVDFFANDAGWPDPNIGARVEGGRELSYYRQDQACLDLVDAGGWDFVVLQEYSIKPTEIGDPLEFKEDVTWFYDRIKTTSPAAHIVLFETWAFQEDHGYYSPYAFEDPEDFLSQLHFHYFDCAENYVPTHANYVPSDDISVAPIGDIWKYHQDEDNPLYLYSIDNKHQNYTGRYLNALVLYSFIFNKPTLGLNNLWLTSPEDAKRLQQTVDCWFGHRCDNTGNIIIAGFQSWDDPVGQNPGEFIELFNPTDQSIAVDNLQIIVRTDSNEDGMAEIYWQLEENLPGMVIEPHQFFLIAEAGVIAYNGNYHDLETTLDLPTSEGGITKRAISIELKINGVHMDYVLYGRYDGTAPAGEIVTGDVFFDGAPWPRKEVIRNTLGTNDFREGMIRRETASALYAPFYAPGYYTDEEALGHGYTRGIWSSPHDCFYGDYVARNSFSPAVLQSDWVSYNDLSPGNSSDNAPFVTEISYDGDAQVLMDYQIGSLLDIQCSGNQGPSSFTWLENSGGQSNAGTDAAMIFGADEDMIVDLSHSIPLYNPQDEFALIFENLDPQSFYTLTLTANHDDPLLDEECYTRVKLQNTISYQNNSSVGVVVYGEDEISFCTGYNRVNGFIAKWTNIESGDDGMISVTSQWDMGYPGSMGFVMGAFRLEKTASNRWLGNISDDWNDRENWESGFQPTTVSDVLIPADPNGLFFPESNSGEEAVCRNLRIESGAQLIIPSNNDLTVLGELMNEAGATGLVLESSPEGSGSLLHHSDNVPATVQLFLTSNQWHYVSSPVEDGQAGVFENLFLRSYSEAADAWSSYITATSEPIIPMKGYAAWAPAEHTLLTFSGNLNNGAMELPVTRQSVEVNQGWNLVGNPYPSSIDWDAVGWNKSAIDNTIYFWEGIGDGDGGNYHYYVGTDGADPGIGVNNGKSVIQPMQGFFVHAHQNGVLAMDNNVREHKHFPFYKKTSSSAQIIRLSVLTEGTQDETVIRFKQGAGLQYDGHMDALKLFSNGVPQLYSITEDGTPMALNSLPEAAVASPLNLGVSIHAEGPYRLQLKQFSGFDYGTDLFLEDIQEDVIVKLSEDTVYQFYTGPADGLRFRLYFFEPDHHSSSNDETVRVFASRGNIQIISIGTAINSTEVFDYTGRLIRTDNSINDMNHIIALPAVHGFVIVRVRTKTDRVSKKIFIP